MRLAAILMLGVAACATAASAQPAPSAEQRAAAWSAHVEALASDAMEGREAGTPGHQRAADYVVAELTRLGLRPAGTDGFFQQVPLVERAIDLEKSSASLTVAGATTAVELPGHALAFADQVPPATVSDAPLVFVGYGLHAPGGGHDDLAGVDLRGKIAVFINGTVPSLSGAHLSHARAQRDRLLAERGAVGVIALVAPSQMQAPWERVAQGAGRPSTVLGGTETGTLRPFLDLLWNPADAQRLFAGASRSFAEVAADAQASRPIRGFALSSRLSGLLLPPWRGARRPPMCSRFCPEAIRSWRTNIS
jgi:hypothetical protein